MIVPILAWLLPAADHGTLEAIHTVLRKLGHFSEYFVLSILVGRALLDERGLRPHHAAMAVTLAAAYAVTDEAHQYFVPGRTAALGDVGIDVLGALAGQVAWVRWARPRVPSRRRAA